MADTEGMTTGQAAEKLRELTGQSFSKQTVRRMADRGDLASVRTREDKPTRDANGNLLRGWRRIDPKSVEAFAQSVTSEPDEVVS